MGISRRENSRALSEPLEPRRFFAAHDVVFPQTLLAPSATPLVILCQKPADAIVIDCASTNGGGSQLRRLLANGQLDTSFGDHGAVNIVGSMDALAALPDGGIVYSISGTKGDTLHRITARGTESGSFGINGRVPLSLQVTSLAADPKGNLFAYGAAVHGGQPQISRINANGGIDRKFGASGVAAVSFPVLGMNNRTTANTATLLADGSIEVTATQFDYLDDERAVVARILPDGGLDPTFGNGGFSMPTTVAPAIVGQISLADNVTVMPDGSFILAYAGDSYSYVGVYNSGYVDAQIHRYNSAGVLDESFGAGGSVILSDDYGAGYQALPRPDGKILLVTAQGQSQPPTEFILLDADGSIDPTFGQGNAVTANQAYPTSSFMLKDGSVIVLGLTNPGVDNSMSLAKYDVNGQLVNSFGYGGSVINPLGFSGQINAAVTLKNGDVIAVGNETPTPTIGPACEAVRYHSDGTIDTSFAARGQLIESVGRNSYFDAAAVASNGDFYVAAAGDDGNSTNPTFVYEVQRFTPSGVLDKKFGRNGSLSFPAEASAISVDSQGNLIVESAPPGQNPSAIWVYRYKADGKPDLKFGIGGKAVVSATPDMTSMGITVQPSLLPMLIERNNSIVIGTGNVVIRLTDKGILDPTFGSAGIATPDLYFSSAVYTSPVTINGIALAPDGDIVIGCMPGVIRLLSNGSMDPTFANAGILNLPIVNSGYDDAQSVACEPDGAILVGEIVQQTPDYTNSFSSAAIFTLLSITSAGSVSNGVVLPLLNPSASFAEPIQIFITQPSGRILVDAFGGSAFLESLPPI